MDSPRHQRRDRRLRRVLERADPLATGQIHRVDRHPARKTLQLEAAIRPGQRAQPPDPARPLAGGLGAEAICNFARAHPSDGYRRLNFMMLDADVVAVSPSSVSRGSAPTPCTTPPASTRPRFLLSTPPSPIHAEPAHEGHAANAETPVFFGHGRNDDVVDVARGKEGRHARRVARRCNGPRAVHAGSP